MEMISDIFTPKKQAGLSYKKKPACFYLGYVLTVS